MEQWFFQGRKFSPSAEKIISIAGAETFKRLERILNKGFERQWIHEDGCSIFFEHPSPRAECTWLALYSDGKVRCGKRGEVKVFERWDTNGFLSFLQRIPKPTFWERTAKKRHELGSNALGLAFVAAIYGFFYWLKQ